MERVVIVHISFIKEFHQEFFNNDTPSFSRKKRMAERMANPGIRYLKSCLCGDIDRVNTMIAKRNRMCRTSFI